MIDAAVKRLTDKGVAAFGVQGDVRKYETCVAGASAVAQHFGRLDFLVNNAAGNFMVSLRTVVLASRNDSTRLRAARRCLPAAHRCRQKSSLRTAWRPSSALTCRFALTATARARMAARMTARMAGGRAGGAERRVPITCALRRNHALATAVEYWSAPTHDRLAPGRAAST